MKKNITCRKCKHRHPARISCAKAKAIAQENAKHRAAQQPPEPNLWEVLMALIQEYTEAAIQESWKGGGDPADIPILEAELELSRSKLNRHMEKMQELL